MGGVVADHYRVKLTDDPKEGWRYKCSIHNAYMKQAGEFLGLTMHWCEGCQIYISDKVMLPADHKRRFDYLTERQNERQEKRKRKVN